MTRRECNSAARVEGVAGEREAFEEAIRSLTDPARHEDVLIRDGGESYEAWPIALAWEIWQKRATLAATAAGEKHE